MKLGMIGLGRMGSGIVRRLQKAGHSCVGFDLNPRLVQSLAKQGVQAAQSMQDLAGKLEGPRTIWIMVPAESVDQTLTDLLPFLAKNDIVIDGGNSHFSESVRRAKDLKQCGLHFLDVGTSGGLWGEGRGYCLMIGGDSATARKLDPIFHALAFAERGYLHCGPSGAGHFVKMVHNGAEYGIMQAYAEAFNILRHADAGKIPYELNLADIAELWRRGSVIASWLLDLTAGALQKSPDLTDFAGQVADSGEGRWTVQAALEEGVPAPVLSAALFERFSSRGQALFANKLLSAMRYEFGGHVEKLFPRDAEEAAEKKGA